ncbi:cell-cycle response regulator DivK [Ignavibacteria bacterium]|jgi:CheY-like chemotaxis protein|nr:response regulator [Bacteroidota bacterium]MCZ2132754.1 response regulator [Bacteroidota bacterium]
MTEHTSTICIIEDNAAIRKLFSVILKKNGFAIVEFEEGTSAMAWLRENMPTAVLCDDILPDINGRDIIKLIRQFPGGKRFCVIATTGFALVADRDRYIALGFDGYISKPINTMTFTEEIREVIASKASAT